MSKGMTRMTDKFRGFRAGLVTAAAMSALVAGGCTTTPDYPTGQPLSLGENASGDPCIATVNWSDQKFGDAKTKFAESFTVSCRGQVSNFTQARVRLFDTMADRDAFTSSLSCGAATSLAMDDFSAASARRCYDPSLGLESVVINADAPGSIIQMSAAANAIGPAVQAARLLSGFDGMGNVTSDREVVSIAQLEAAPLVAGTVDEGKNLDADETLAIATRQLFLGNHANASRLLSSALTQVGPGTPPRTETALLLEAGLADSNIRFFESAENRFSEAETLLQSTTVDGATILGRRLAIYRGLHAMNRGNFAQAKAILSPIYQGRVSGDMALSDPISLSILNSAQVSGDVRNALSLPDLEQLREVVLTSQAYWALSVASLSENDRRLAREALEAARESIGSISGVERAGVLWLEARLDRQLGRIEAAQGNYGAALDAFDDALAKLTRSSLSGIGTGAEPAIAELTLQRASILEDSGAPGETVDAAYAQAVNALVNARGQQAAFDTAPLIPYLNRLLERSKAGDTAALAAYFQTLQVTTESGAARQISQLQNQISSNSEVGALIRDHSDAERRLNEVEFLIREAGTADAALLARRAELQQEFIELDAQLQSETRINRISDRPAELAELQGMLSPGETYLKLTVIGDTIYGMMIDANGATPYRVEASAATIRAGVGGLRGSIDGSLERGTLTEFNVPVAAALYSALFGQIDAQLDGRSSIVVDGGESLRTLSPAVLVTDTSAASRRLREGPSLDYSNVPFMIQKAPLSISTSPSSFIASRRLGASEAPEPLIGFASPEALPATANASQQISVGPCLLAPTELSDLSRRYAPIPKREIEVAANALGLRDIKIVEGDEFTDSNVVELGRSNGTLSRYKILHFATHGASEGQFGCAESPAALLTSFGQEGSDMLLSFDEIPNLDLDANLVVLSACETVGELSERSRQLAGGVQPGETLDGLVKAFFSANARAVMATYWEASAGADSEIFFDRFYSSGRSTDIAGSLQAAQLDLIGTSEYSHPFFWGPFFVVGNTANGMLSSGGAGRAADEANVPSRVAAYQRSEQHR